MIKNTSTKLIPFEELGDTNDINNREYIDFIYLTDSNMPDYNEKEECLNGVLDGTIDQDIFGGNILFGNLLIDE